MNSINSTGSYVLPFFLAVVFHLAIGFGVNVHWSSAGNIVKYDHTAYLNATLVSENPFTAKQRREAAERQQRKRTWQKREREKERLEKKKLAEQQEAARLARLQNQLEKQKLHEAMQKLSTESTPESKSKQPDREQERQLMEQNLASAVKGEQTYQIAVTDDEKAIAYVGQIKRDIIQNWSRPPSARNGMQALLKVYLVPTGEVVDVVVAESSGNEAFDRSAVLAVRKSERFAVPQSARQFEKNFREFSVLFKPEDLRL